MRRIVLFLSIAFALALLPGTALAQASPVDPPQQVAQLRQQYEGLTLEQIQAAGYAPEGTCVPSPTGVGAMGTHAINGEYLTAQFPNGTMDPTTPPALLLDQNNKVMGVEWEARDVGQGPMQLFGQTIQLQPPHPGVDEPHYMLHIYFKADGKVRFGSDPQTAFDPELRCPEMPETGGLASPAQLLGGILLALAGGVAVVGVALAVRRRRQSLS